MHNGTDIVFGKNPVHIIGIPDVGIIIRSDPARDLFNVAYTLFL